MIDGAEKLPGMKVTPSAVRHCPYPHDDPGFGEALSLTVSAVSLDRLERHCFLRNCGQPSPIRSRFLGAFRQLDGKAKPCALFTTWIRCASEKAGLPPGAHRFVCAEASFTTLAVRAVSLRNPERG